MARAGDAPSRSSAGGVVELDQRAHIMSLEFKEAAIPTNAERVVSAQVLQNLGDHTGAITLLLDVLDSDAAAREAEDAMFLLGDSFYALHDYQSSRHYFENALEPFIPSERAQLALVRLIDIALATENFDHVPDYFAKLAQLPSTLVAPAVPYAKAKYLFFREQLAEAEASFAAIGPASPYYFQARYFIATIALKKGDLVGALSGFTAIVQLEKPAATALEVEIQDLARLAAGRIFYKSGKLQPAIRSYESISRPSKHFSDAQFEVGWIHIETGDLVRAVENFENLLRPGALRNDAPEIGVLLGDLKLRVGRLRLAGEDFARIRNTFEPMYEAAKKLETGTLSQLEASGQIPPMIAEWIRADPEMARMIEVESSVADIRTALAATADTLAVLEDAMIRQNKVTLFANLADVRDGSADLLRRLVPIRATFDQGPEILSRADAVESQLLALDGRVDREADKQLDILKAQIAGERARSEALEDDLEAMVTEADDLGRSLLAQALSRVTSRLYELVVRSDVGLMDVAWARKAESSRMLQRLQAERILEETNLEKKIFGQVVKLAPKPARDLYANPSREESVTELPKRQ